MTRPSEKDLSGSIVRVCDISHDTRQAMYELMASAYVVESSSFFNDLAAKNWAILLHDSRHVLRGFTSLAVMDTDADRPIRALFSGDTIIQPEFWGSLELPRVWGRFMLQMINESGDRRLYWFLISSGYKTYRFLPVFFLEYFPRHDAPMPEQMKTILDHLGRARFGERYDADRGIIHLEHPTPLRPGVADLSPERLHDPHVAFFVERNPDHARGDELACIAELRVDNLKPFIRRALKV